ncbi:hypothetical protein [Undibacterium flavidum]|uniref:Uncharacterized protein n=1 Tax=Undibacterium flavidum TaxID=2762297 RepID=A0ABR6Y7U3_9BURK|nr:hypothetical protein [Undibacterium flavidum]MBC3872655.1 hypothetical protein [Undibacterium flavidum]
MLTKTTSPLCELPFRQPIFSLLIGLHIAAAFLFVISTRPTGWLVLPATFIPLYWLGYGRQMLNLPSYWGKVKKPDFVDSVGWRLRLLVVLYPSSVFFGIWFGLEYRPHLFSDVDLIRYAFAVATGVILPPLYLMAVRAINTSKES